MIFYYLRTCEDGAVECVSVTAFKTISQLKRWLKKRLRDLDANPGSYTNRTYIPNSCVKKVYGSNNWTGTKPWPK